MSNDYEAFQARQFASRKARKRARKKFLDTLPVDRRRAFLEAETADIGETRAVLKTIRKRLSDRGGYISSSPKPEDRDP